MKNLKNFQNGHIFIQLFGKEFRAAGLPFFMLRTNRWAASSPETVIPFSPASDLDELMGLILED